MACELESDLPDTVVCGGKWFVDFNAQKSQLVLFEQSNNSGAIDVKVDRSVSYSKMFGLSFPYNFDWDSYIVFIVKIASKKNSLDSFYEVSFS